MVASGTLTKINHEDSRGVGGQWMKYKCYITSGADGKFDTNGSGGHRVLYKGDGNGAATTKPCIFDGKFQLLQIIPDTGGTAPDDEWDLAVYDQDDVAISSCTDTGLEQVGTTTKIPTVTDGTTTHAFYPISGPIYIVADNMGAANCATLVFWVGRA